MPSARSSDRTCDSPTDSSRARPPRRGFFCLTLLRVTLWSTYIHWLEPTISKIPEHHDNPKLKSCARKMMRPPVRLLVARARRPERLHQAVNARGDLIMD